MKVTISRAVFEDAATNQTALITLFGFGFQERCRVVVSPTFLPSLQPTGHPVVDWLQTLPAKLRNECSAALDFGVKAEAAFPSSRSILVSTNPQPNWQPAEPILPVSKAVEFLSKPLRILVENRRHDRGFLLATSSPEDRDALEKAEANGSALFDHAGGLGEMLALVESVHDNREESFRMWALFDSDRLQPGQPNPASERVKAACGSSVPTHQLVRRSIENYLPLSVLSAGLRHEHVVHKVRAYASMTRPQRNHFNLKGGFQGDRGRTDGVSAGSLYDDLNLPARGHLEAGFGKNVASLFLREDLRVESWYADDDQSNETGPMVRKLLALI